MEAKNCLKFWFFGFPIVFLLYLKLFLMAIQAWRKRYSPPKSMGNRENHRVWDEIHVNDWENGEGQHLQPLVDLFWIILCTFEWSDIPKATLFFGVHCISLINHHGWNPYYSKGSRQDGFIRETSYDEISKVRENLDFQIWDYGADFLDLVRHLYSKKYSFMDIWYFRGFRTIFRENRFRWFCIQIPLEIL